MTEIQFHITPESVRQFARMFDIPIADGELESLAAQLAGSMAGVLSLWQVDVSGTEPPLILSIDQSDAP